MARHPARVFTSSLAGTAVLVVDDDPDTLAMLATLLKLHGAEVTTAASAQEALAALSLHAPDVLVSDIAMPREDGYDLIRQVRHMSPERGGLVPAIALTARAGAEDRAFSLDNGFQIHLNKPVDPETLVSAIVQLLKLW